jgi:hypothetical protein
MLRTAIAVAAAGLGGADTITVVPHTAPLGLPDALARRIARNTQLVLLEESNLARVADPPPAQARLRRSRKSFAPRPGPRCSGDRGGRRRLGGAASRPDPAKRRRGARRAAKGVAPARTF